MGDLNQFLTWLPAYQAGVQAAAVRNKSKQDSDELEQRKMEEMNRVAQEQERMRLLQQQQEIARINAMTSAATAERLSAQQQFTQQKALDKEQRGQQFLQGVRGSLDRMIPQDQGPMPDGTGIPRRAPTLEELSTAAQENLAGMSDPEELLQGMARVTAMKAEARQEKEKTPPKSIYAVPVLEPGTDKLLQYQGPNGKIDLMEVQPLYDANGNFVGNHVPSNTKMAKPGSGLNLGGKYGINSGSVTNSVKKPFTILKVTGP